jgi:hypothetical protein
MKLLKQEASQSDCACLSATGDEAELLCSACTHADMLQFNNLTGTKVYQNKAVRCLTGSQDNCDSIVCLPWPLDHKRHPHLGIGRPPFDEPNGSSGVHTEEQKLIL